jgi:ATP-dependent Lon protease
MEENYTINQEQPYFEVLPIKNTVLFPGVLLPIAVSKKSSLKLIKVANKDNR